MDSCMSVCVVEFSELKFNSSQFCVSSLLHPRSLVNLVLFGSRQGRLQLWNINTTRLVYTFMGWDSPVTVLEQVINPYYLSSLSVSTHSLAGTHQSLCWNR